MLRPGTSIQKHAREFLLWCLPAILFAVALRTVLMVQMPHAIYHDDSADLLSTADTLLNDGKLRFHVKKTFLVPLLYTAAVALPVPALVTISLAQHTLGVGLVLVSGLLCRLWFRAWKFFIIPVTVIVAINPALIWYEHMLLAETVFVFCVALVALSGTVFAMTKTRASFVFFCVSLVLLAGARPEGKLLFGFGLLLTILVFWTQWKPCAIHFAALLLVALFTHFATKTGQAGLLLYTSVARLTPAELRCAPGFQDYIAPLQSQLSERWELARSFPTVNDRRDVAALVKQYLTDREGNPKQSKGDVNRFCLTLAMETCRRNFFRLPALAFHKFNYTAGMPPHTDFDQYWMVDRQRDSYVDELPQVLSISGGLFGRQMHSANEVEGFVTSHFDPKKVAWFSRWNAAWNRALNAWRLPDRHYSAAVVNGLPIYFILALAGLLCAMIRSPRSFHVSWGLALIGFWFVIMLTANIKPRFRFVFEPFWFIYIALLADAVWSGSVALVRRICPA